MSAEVYVAELCRWFVLIALLSAAIGKTFGFRRFRDSLSDAFAWLKGAGASFAAGAIVVGEWAAGLSMLAGGALSRAGLTLALCLFVFLTAVVAVVLANGLSVRCNCFGPSQRRISGHDFARNLLFIAAASFGLYGASATGVAGASGGIAWPAVVAIAAVAATLFLLAIGLRELAHVLRIDAEDL